MMILAVFVHLHCIKKVGDKVTALKVGDWVIPRGGGFGEIAI